jgi:hypothetical protein
MLCTLTIYNSVGKIKKIEMCRSCSTYERRGAFRVLVGKPEGRRQLGKPTHRLEYNIKFDIREE